MHIICLSMDILLLYIRTRSLQGLPLYDIHVRNFISLYMQLVIRGRARTYTCSNELDLVMKTLSRKEIESSVNSNMTCVNTLQRLVKKCHAHEIRRCLFAIETPLILEPNHQRNNSRLTKTKTNMLFDTSDMNEVDPMDDSTNQLLQKRFNKNNQIYNDPDTSQKTMHEFHT